MPSVKGSQISGCTSVRSKPKISRCVWPSLTLGYPASKPWSTSLQRGEVRWAALGKASRGQKSVTAKFFLSHHCLCLSRLTCQVRRLKALGIQGHFPTSSERRLLSVWTGWNPPDVRTVPQVCCGILCIKVLCIH